jgi:hypothetical protein
MKNSYAYSQPQGMKVLQLANLKWPESGHPNGIKQ